MYKKLSILAISAGLVISMAACSNSEDPEYTPIDPGLLPSQNSTVTSVPLETENSIDVSPNVDGAEEEITLLNPSAVPVEPVVAGMVLESYPAAMPDNLGVYHQSDDKYLVIDNTAPLSGTIIDDTKRKIQNINTGDNPDTNTQKTIQTAWFESATKDLKSASGISPIIVYSGEGFVRDNKDPSEKWFYWVMTDTLSFSSAPLDSQQNAHDAAQKWIDDNPDAGSFIIINQ